MRALQVQVERSCTEAVLALARDHDAPTPVALPAETSSERPVALILLTLPNESVGTFVAAVRGISPTAEFVLFPIGVIPLQPPLQRLDERIRDVSRLSTLELVIASLQSVGAWRGMLLFSVLAGVIGGYGLIFDTGYLLVAAMLINPMGAPALVAVVALAIGDLRMFGRGGVRFLVSLLVQALAALALGLAYGLSVSTPMMEQVTSLSVWAAVVAFAAGAAGAQTQVKSDRDSLVSGTASGFMVAAALAPPAAVLGLSIPLGRWDYTLLMAFLLTLQFVAIGVGGWFALRLFGVQPGEAAVHRGSRLWRTALLIAVSLAVVGLVALQQRLEPRFQRADLSRAALVIVRDAVARVPGAEFIESDAHFTRASLQRHAAETMLIRIAVEHGAEAGANGEQIADAVRAEVERLVRERMSGVLPFVDVTVLPVPRSPP